jgi:hypothetical protein
MNNLFDFAVVPSSVSNSTDKWLGVAKNLQWEIKITLFADKEAAQEAQEIREEQIRELRELREKKEIEKEMKEMEEIRKKEEEMKELARMILRQRKEEVKRLEESRVYIDSWIEREVICREMAEERELIECAGDVRLKEKWRNRWRAEWRTEWGRIEDQWE